LDADLAAAVANSADHVTLLESCHLHGEVRVDAAASGFDVDVGAERGRQVHGNATRARVHLQALDRGQQIELRAAAPRIDVDACCPDAVEAHAAGTDVR